MSSHGITKPSSGPQIFMLSLDEAENIPFRIEIEEINNEGKLKEIMAKFTERMKNVVEECQKEIIEEPKDFEDIGQENSKENEDKSDDDEKYADAD